MQACRSVPLRGDGIHQASTASTVARTKHQKHGVTRVGPSPLFRHFFWKLEGSGEKVHSGIFAGNLRVWARFPVHVSGGTAVSASPRHGDCRRRCQSTLQRGSGWVGWGLSDSFCPWLTLYHHIQSTSLTNLTMHITFRALRTLSPIESRSDPAESVQFR